MSLPWWEFILRGVCVYLFLLTALRLTGKRQIEQLSPFDLVLLLIISNAVQNSMNGGDNSLVGGLIIAGALILLNSLVGILTYKYKFIGKLVDGQPEILIHNGKVNKTILAKQNMTKDELDAVLRKNDCLHIEEVRYAVLEANGEISVIKKK